MMAWLNKLLNVRPNEWSRLLLLSAILILSNVGSSWGTTVAYAAFLKQSGLNAGLETLIWVLLLSSVLSFPALALYSIFVDRIDTNKMFAYIVVADGLIILLSMGLLALNLSLLAFPLLYVLSLACTAVFNPHFFTYVNETYDIQSAKRALPLILAAGRLGGTLAGFTLQFLTAHLSTEAIIWIWLLSDILTIGIIYITPVVLKEKKKLSTDVTRLKTSNQDTKPGISSPITNLQEAINFTLQSNFLRWMAIGTLLLTALMIMLEYHVNKIMIPLFASQADYAGFLGLLNGISNLVALAILLFGMSRITKAWGVGNTSLIFPVSNLLICAGLIGFPGLISASLANVDRRGLRFSLQTSIEALLYNAIPLRLKGRARAFVGGQVAPIGAITGVVLLLIAQKFGANVAWLVPTLIVLIAGAYLINSIIIRQQYTQALVKMLEEEDYSFLLAEEASELVVADPATLQRLKKKLDESTSHEMRIFMTQLIAQVGGVESLSILVPALKATEEARTRAAMLNILAAANLRGDKTRELYLSFLSDSNAQVRQVAASGLEQLLGAKDPWFQEQLISMVNDPDAQVSLYALQSLATTGEFYKFGVAVEKLNQLLNSDLVEDKKNAIDTLGKISLPQSIEQILAFLQNENDQLRLEAILELENQALPTGNVLSAKILENIRPLAQDPVARIRQAVLQVMGKYKNKEDYPALVSSMGDKNPQVRAMAVDVLVDIGKDVIPLIQNELKNPDSLTQNMAAVALSRIQPRQFATLIEVKVSGNLGNIYQNIGLEQALSIYDKYSSVRVLLAALQEINREQIDEILYLLSAIHTSETLKIVKDSLDSELPSTRNLALEALESLTSPKLAALIASLFEPSMATTQLFQLGKENLNIEHIDLTQAFERLLSPNETRGLNMLAIHTLGDVYGSVSIQAPKQSTSKVAKLWDAIETPAEKVVPAPPLPPQLRSLLQEALNNPEPLIQQSARTAFQKIEYVQKGITTETTNTIENSETEQLSIVQRIIILKEISFFHSISINQLEMLAKVCEQKKYTKDARIFKKGDPGGVLYILVDGEVGIEQEKRVGSALLATIEKGSYFGEMSLFDNSPRSASATAMKDCFVLELNRAPIITLTMQNPDLALELINMLSQRIRETSDKIADAARSRPRELHKLYDQFD